MFLNISNPLTGQVLKKLDIEDDKILSHFYDKRISAEIDASILGPQWAGYVLKIVGGYDKQGFPMMQGVLTYSRVKLLFKEGTGRKCFHMNNKRGQMKRKAVRGCIVSPDIRALNLIVVQKGNEDIAGLTDDVIPRRLQPQRATRIRKLYGLPKGADVREYVIHREVHHANGRVYRKAPAIQRLTTDLRHRRKVEQRAKTIEAARRSTAALRAFKESRKQAAKK